MIFSFYRLKSIIKYFPLIIILVSSFSYITAQSETPLFTNFDGQELINEIASNYKPTTVLNYSNAKDLMYGTIYREGDSVSCVYSGHTVFLPKDIDPSTFLYMNGNSNGINAEHTYPRSKGASEGNAHSDMHHLFPTRSPINSSRSNFPFGEIEDNQVDTWFYLDKENDEIPSEDIDLYSERINGKFEPREDHKGNVARAMFYFYTMYKEEALSADPEFFQLQREILCEWHILDPVDLLEWERTYLIAEYQDGQPNPFILDSTLAGRAFCGKLVSSTKNTQVSEKTVFPNPMTDFVNVVSKGENQLRVIDIYGNTILKKVFTDSIKLDLLFLNPGNYFIIINGEVTRVLKV